MRSLNLVLLARHSQNYQVKEEKCPMHVMHKVEQECSKDFDRREKGNR
jgi:hypothetical protein